MELKHFLSDINDLRIHESNKHLSEWGKDKLKEYEFILTELIELKKLRVADVIKNEVSVCECGSTKFNTTVKDKPFCFLCGKDARQTVL